MNSTMHHEVLTPKGAKIFPDLTRFKGFYLAGGTGLALQLGHRISIDFDLFSDEEIPKSLLKKIADVFHHSVIQPIVNNSEELTVSIDGVKVTFLYYPFPLVTDLVMIDQLPAASIQEIAAMKAYTIGRRASYKDYVDIYTILSSNILNLETIISLANKKYGDQFNDRLFLEQLVSLEDVPDEPIQFLGKEVGRERVQGILVSHIRHLKL